MIATSLQNILFIRNLSSHALRQVVLNLEVVTGLGLFAAQIVLRRPLLDLKATVRPSRPPTELMPHIGALLNEVTRL